jgi:hypothetical protein
MTIFQKNREEVLNAPEAFPQPGLWSKARARIDVQ